MGKKYSYDELLKKTEEVEAKYHALSERLKQERILLRTIIDSLPDAIYAKDLESRKILANNTDCQNCGFEKEEDVIGKNDFDIFPAEIAEILFDDDKKVLKEGVSVLDKEEYIRRLNFDEKCLLTSKLPLYDDKGKIIGLVGIGRDITNRKRAEENIREMDIRMNKLFANVPDLVYQFTRRPDGSYYVPIASKGIRNIFGCSPEDVLDSFEPISRVIHPEDAARVFEDIEYSAKHLTYFTCEFRVHIPGKDIQWILSRSTPEKLSDGSVTWFGFNADITERKQSELLIQNKSEEITTQNEELNQANQELFASKVRAEESENKWKTLVKTIPDWIAIIDKDDKFVFMNQFAEGFDEGDVIGVSVLDFILGPSKQVFSDALKKTRESKTLQGFEHFAYGDNMSESYYHNFMVPMDLKEGSILIISRDITERKQSEIALIRSERELKNAQQIAHMGNWELDIINNKLYWSDEIYRIFDCEPQEFNATYEAFLEFIHPDDKEKVNAAYSNSLETQTEYEIEHRLITKTNKIKFVKEKCSTTFNEQGKPLSSFGIVIDITEQKQIEIELQKAKEKAEESERLKSAFLANMSHEIRTPMNGILGFAQLLKTPGLKGEKQQAFIEIIEKSGNRMLSIINDIIDISKIESGLMNIDRMETNINELVEDIYTFFKPEAEAKKLKLSFKNPLPAQKAIIKTDNEKVYAILTNLVKNAIKYSLKGTIELGYYLKPDSEPGEIEFYVKDTGIGIPKERQEAIFERFIQADITDKIAHQGAGLGLTITKAYVEMLGGNIWVESEEDKGSIFYFTLPYNTEAVIEAIDREIKPSGKNKTVRKLKILIAEDDEISKMLLDETVKNYGEEVLIVRTGFETIEVCRTNPDIDLILMDIQMPEMGGYEATKQIREFNKDVIIIAQTAYGLSGDKEKAMEAGCNDYIAKPIDENELHSMIQKYFGK